MFLRVNFSHGTWNKIKSRLFIFRFKQLIGVTSKGFTDLLYPNFSFFQKSFATDLLLYHLLLSCHARSQKLRFVPVGGYTRGPLRPSFTTFRQLVGIRLISGNYRLSTLTADPYGADLPIFTLQLDARLQTARFSRNLLFVNAYRPRKHERAHLSLSFFFVLFFLRPSPPFFPPRENSFTLPGLRQIVRPVRSHPRGKSNQLSLCREIGRAHV